DDTVDQVVAVLGPVQARRRVADVVRHGRRARREDRDVASPLALQLQLRALEARADLVVRDAHRPLGAGSRRILQLGKLRVANRLQALRRGRVMPVTINDHFAVPPIQPLPPLLPYRFIALSILSRSAMEGTTLAALDSGSRPSRIALTN